MHKNTARLEAILFAAGDFVQEKDLLQILQFSQAELVKHLGELKKYLQNSGLELVVHNKSYQLTTAKEFTADIHSLQKTKPPTLSQAALEVLAIVAYRQPVSKSDIEQIRGVSSDQSIRNLLTKDLISERHNKNKTQTIYRTTGQFLLQLGLDDINKLPKVDEPRKSH